VGEIVLDRKLWETVEAWLPGSAKAATTRDYYKRCFAMLRRNADFSDTMQIRALATVDWQALYDRWPTGAVTWNRVRGALSRFLTMTMGDKYDPFRRGVMAKLPRADEGEGRPRYHRRPVLADSHVRAGAHAAHLRAHGRDRRGTRRNAYRNSRA